MEYEGKDKPHSETGGVKAIPIEGRFHSQRERLAGGFTDADRAWRKQFLNDQILHNEPAEPTWFYKERYNPIRRAYRWPLETLFKKLEPTLGENWTLALRYWTGKMSLGLLGVYAGYYIFKYRSNEWYTPSGWTSVTSKPFRPLGHPDFAKVEEMKPADYYDNRLGLKDSPI